ncbi:Rib/alpha-like domain-containing protein [Enterococcus faecalis]|uniref:Rib/alpha-like domain-containing protein n=1 Tax=Enterococcus faecalis TaxID=1351 RepID=UPI002F90C99A
MFSFQRSTIDTNTPGNYEGVIEVTYPDGTKDTVKVPVEVTDNRSDADKYTPMVEGEKVEIGGKVDLTDNVTNLPTLPQGTTTINDLQTSYHRRTDNDRIILSST